MTIELKPIQLKAAQLLATGTSVIDTADQINSTRQTVHNWLKNDINFIAYLNSLKLENLENARSRLQSVSVQAVTTLVDVMEKSTNDNARINAACKVLEMSGLTKDSLNMYAWGIGGETPEKVKAEKIMESLTLF